MPLISRDVPAFASSNSNVTSVPNLSNDDQPNTTWIPDGYPAWLAYDLSGAPEEQRQNVLVAWYGPKAGGYISIEHADYTQLPIDYTIEINAGAGGGSPPADGWQEVVNVTANDKNSREHLINLDGGNWIRMSLTESSHPMYPSFDLDVYAAPNGPSDAWLIMGDSISFITFPYATSNLPSLVNDQAPERWPAVINAAIGGTNTGYGIEHLDETLVDYPGRFVVLAYGTNNHPENFDMETLVTNVIAKNKVPVIPHLPWSDTSGIQAEGPIMNAEIDAVIARHPEAVAGPDLWAAFENRLDLIPSGDVHPNAEGQEHLRQTWADWMVAHGE
jgi:hypothetical protein